MIGQISPLARKVALHNFWHGIRTIPFSVLMVAMSPVISNLAIADDSIRILTVNIAADPAFRQKINWEEAAKKTIQTVSNIYEHNFGIRLQPLHLIEWNPPAEATTSDALIQDLYHKITQQDADILIGFYNSRFTDTYAGMTIFLGSIAVIGAEVEKSSSYTITQANILSHELAHLFGAFHPRVNIRSVLNGDGEDVMDPQTAQVVHLMRQKDFKKGELAILDFDETTVQAYLKIYEEGHRRDELNPLAATLATAGQSLYKANKLDEAANILLRSITLEDRIPGSHAVLAKIYTLQNKPELALEESKRAVSTAPGNADFLVDLAIAQDRLGNISAAQHAFESAVKASPELAETHYNLGLNYIKNGQLAEAEAELHEAIRINPKYVQAYSDLGISLGMQGRLAESVKALRDAIKLDPRHSKSHANLGYTLALMGDWNAAIAEYQVTLKLDPNDSRTKFNLKKALTQISKATNK